jgi:alcohol dehydrogenase class IV
LIAERFVDELASLCDELAVPTPRSYGIDKSAWEATVPVMAQQALDSGSPANNPVVPTKDQIQAIYGAIYG